MFRILAVFLLIVCSCSAMNKREVKEIYNEPVDPVAKLSRPAENNQELLSFFKARSLQPAALLIKEGADVNTVDADNGYTVLHYAAQCNDMGGIIFLAEQGAQLEKRDAQGRTPLEIAVVHGNKNAAHALLIKGAQYNGSTSCGETYLHLAIKKHSLSLVKLLVDRGALIHKINTQLESPLVLAVLEDQLDITKYLVEHGADIKTTHQGSTLLHTIAHKGSADLCRYLISQKCSIDAPNNELMTPLHVASNMGNEPVLECLLDNGASVFSTSKKSYSPLHYAVLGGQLGAVRILLNKGAATEARTNHGDTPLHLAALHTHDAIIEELIKRGANASAVTIDGRTVSDIVDEQERLKQQSQGY